MKHKLFKTHRKRSYYQLRRLSTVSLSLALAFIAIVVPFTLDVGAFSSDENSSSVSSSSEILLTSSETTSSETSSGFLEYIDNIALEKK